MRQGDEIALNAHITGSPYPTITWIRNDEVIRPEEIKKRVDKVVPRRKKEAVVDEPFHLSLPERLTVDNSRQGESELSVRDSIRADYGVFTIKVENDHGVAKASCEVNVLGMQTFPKLKLMQVGLIYYINKYSTSLTLIDTYSVQY